MWDNSGYINRERSRSRSRSPHPPMSAPGPSYQIQTNPVIHGYGGHVSASYPPPTGYGQYLTREYQPGAQHQFSHGPSSPIFAPPPQHIIIHHHSRQNSSHTHSQSVQYPKVYAIQPNTQYLQNPRAHSRSRSRSPSPNRMPIPVAASNSAPPMHIPSPIHAIHPSQPLGYHGHPPTAMVQSHSAPQFPIPHAQISSYPPSTIPPLETQMQFLSIQGGHKPPTPTSAARPLKSAMKPGREFNRYPERIILNHSSSSVNLGHPPSPSGQGRNSNNQQSPTHHSPSGLLTKPHPSHKRTSSSGKPSAFFPGAMNPPLAVQMSIDQAPEIIHVDERGRRRTTSFGKKPSLPGVSSTHATHGSAATKHPQFQYSRCTGRRKALCIGINYRGQPNELRGCINDARHVRDFLIRHHRFHPSDVHILTDGPDSHQRDLPTRANILAEMKWLVRSARADDSLFIHYSGHGGQVQDKDGDEVDGWDEVIYPVDFRKAGHILDDEMHDILVRPLPSGCRLTAIFDCCHSGTALDLPYIYSSHGRLKGSRVSSRARRDKGTKADVISFSGCKDGQTSADTFAGSVAVGAMSHAFISTLSTTPNQSYQELLRSIRLILHPRYSQKPQMGSSHHIDTNLQFVI